MNPTGTNIVQEDPAVYMARMKGLAHAVLDRTLDKEMRLAAQMRIDAEFWARRFVAHNFVDADDAEPDAAVKIIAAHKASDRRKAIRDRAERLTRGLPMRPRRGISALGIWNSRERTDRFSDSVCAVCGHGFDTWARPRSATCSPRCARALRKARRQQ